MEDEWISASDVEKFGYCPLSWWLSLSKEEEAEGENLKKGQEEHQEMGDKLKSVQESEKKLNILENIIFALAISASLVSFFGLTLIFPGPTLSFVFRALSLIWILAALFFLIITEKHRDKAEKTSFERIILILAIGATILTGFSLSLLREDDVLAQILHVMSLSWLIGASYWLKHSFTLKNEAESTREELKVEDGDVKYVDALDEESDLLISEKYKLRGRPDYILEKDEGLVPVEVKTGRVPKGPFFSHILQLAAYCLLIEEDMGEKPPYGLIRYGETEFDIDYDESLKELLLEKLELMRDKLDTEEVHRNHHREGKCANCSRRDICPESLA